MSPLIDKVVKLANITFANIPGKDNVTDNKSFAANFNKLKYLLSNIRASDVMLMDDFGGQSTSKSSASFFRRLLPNSSSSSSSSRSSPAHGRAPVAYTEIFETDAFTIGMFALRGAGIRIPLHDHPGMHGIIKVIHGVVTVNSYSRSTTVGGHLNVDANITGRISVKRLAEVVLDVDSDPCCLSPDVGNYHEIKAIGGPAAFVDILSPPYDHDGSPNRECRFYRCDESKSGSGLGSDTILTECGQPLDFWSDNIPYTGPKVNVSDDN